MRLPDESRPRLFRRASFALDRLNDAVVAAEFVFITIGMVMCSSGRKSGNELFQVDLFSYLFIPLASYYIKMLF
ncbi:uncharacterized protein METZ01_LOCUS368104, partial [marine metagenome]